MAHLWAQEWRSNSGTTAFSLHINKDAIVVFGLDQNRGRSHGEKLSMVGSPWRHEGSLELVKAVTQSGHGKLINWRP